MQYTNRAKIGSMSPGHDATHVVYQFWVHCYALRLHLRKYIFRRKTIIGNYILNVVVERNGSGVELRTLD